MKNYFYFLLFILFLGLGSTSYAQISPSQKTLTASEGIEDLSIYPNPVSTGKIYIATKENGTKEIEIYDVLGKKILFSRLFGKELNISKLTAGIYILKIKEGEHSATRKLVVR